MAIERITSDSDINDQIQRFIDAQKAKIINLLAYIGEKCVSEARQSGAYQDRTGNLRASVAYCIVDSGNIISKHVEGSTADGKLSAEEQLKSIVSKYSYGLVLIVVAGMNYAAYVEAMNLNVLSSAELLAEKEVPILMKQLGLAA